MVQRYRRYVFTLNNYASLDEQRLQAPHEFVRYVLYGREVAESGTPHLQGVVLFNRVMSVRQVKTLFNLPSMHLEQMRGSFEQATEYCKKDGDVYERGDPPKPGARSDLAAIKEAIDEGADEKEIAESHFKQWVRYRRSFSRYREIVRAKERNWKSQVWYIWGSTGSGKTRWVHEKEPSVWIWGGDRWFDGYAGHDAVLFDDFRGGFRYNYMLKLLDRYPMRVPIKGGFVNWQPKRIYITANISLADQYPGVGESRAPLVRRIENVINME